MQSTLTIDVEDDNMARPLASMFSLELSSCRLSALCNTESSVRGVRSTPENDGSLPLCGLNGTEVRFLPLTC